MSAAPLLETTIEHLFRNEWGNLVSVLTKVFGPRNLQLAEDIAQDTLEKALQHWKINGLPEKPTAWLFTVARNKAIDTLRRQKRQQQYAKEISVLLKSEFSLVPTVHQLVNTLTLEDDRLGLMFLCCHPVLSAESQIALVLKSLCGFSVQEIAKAFLMGTDTIEKRLYRARQTLQDKGIEFEMPNDAELASRLETVLAAIYLLFNEGYSSTQHRELIRLDVMEEAMRLCYALCESNMPFKSHAQGLMALMCFTASRSLARLDEEGNMLLLKQQDRNKWNKELICTGVRYMELSRFDDAIGKYHIEAGIAYEHAKASDYSQTNWTTIVAGYDVLYQLHPSPIVGLNRAIALSELYGAQTALEAIDALPNLSSLKNYYLLPAVLGELHLQLQHIEKAAYYLEQARGMTHSPQEKKLLQQKIQSISGM